MPATPSTGDRRSRRVFARTARGVTFLEVVLGVTLLGLVAGTFSMAVGAIGGSFQRQRDRIGAAEVASRILLIRADDEEFMPDPSRTIAYGDREFRWTIEEGPVQITLSEPAQAALASGASGSTIDLSKRMLSISVRVWLAETTGGSFQFQENVPSYTLVRLIDPIDFTTSDSAERRLESQRDIEDFMGNVIGSMNTGEGGGGGGGRNTQRSRPSQPTPINPPARDGGGGRRPGGGGRTGGGGG